MNERRLVVAGFGALLAAIVGYLLYEFIAAITVAVFLYYATRRFYDELDRFRLPKRVRAALTISTLGIPLVLLLSYTVILLAVEAREFLQTSTVFEAAPDDVAWFEGIEDLPELTTGGLIEAYRAGQLDVFIEFIVEHAAFVTSIVTGLLLNLLIVVIVTYYLLIHGSRFRQWLLQYDENGSVGTYFEAADDELEGVLFGNLLNVIVISLISIVVFSAYNAVAPTAAEVPYPALAGALTGIASLIPVVGMKVVYFPLAAAASLPMVLEGDLTLLPYIVVFLLLTFVIVDTIPDLILRPYFSGKRTHVGLLMLAYIFGPVVFGFYGLFFAPIVLVLGLTFYDTMVPQLLGTEPEPEQPPGSQTELDEFG